MQNQLKARLFTPRSRHERWFYLLISPWLIGFVLFQGGPLLAALLLAFTNWEWPQPPAFAGLTHFQTMTADPLFAKTLLNSAYYAFGTVPLGIGVGLGLALLVNRRLRGIIIFRAIFFLPVVISGVALALLWGWLFNPRFGPVNNILAAIGITGPGWLQDKNWAMPSLILMSVWQAGINMVIYLAALQQVPAALHEAAALDGAGTLGRFRHITWPLISPVTLYLTVIGFIASFQLFTPTYILTQGGPENATLTLPLYIYFNAFSWGQPGYAAALAAVLFLLILGLTLLQFRLARRWVFYAGIPA
jgi:multiple sugar transport system permease protein